MRRDKNRSRSTHHQSQNHLGIIRSYFSGMSRDTVLLAFTSLFSDISTEMLYPIIPIFLTQTLNASGSAIGLIEGIAQATQNIVQGFSGWLSDHFQKRKPIALMGYFLGALAKPMIGLSKVWQIVLGARFLDRFGSGVRSAPRDALVAASVDEQHRGKAFGLEGFGDNFGAFLGPLLTVFLLTSMRLEIHSIFFISIIPGLLAFLMIVFVKEGSSRSKVKKREPLDLKAFPQDYWKYLITTALFGLGNSSNSFLILRTREIGISLEITIVIYAFFNLIAAIISYPAGYLSDHLGRKPVLACGFIIFLITYFGFAVSENLVLIGALFILYGLFQGIFRSVGKAFASDLVPERYRASGVGWYSMIVGITGLISSSIAGLIWDHINHSAVFMLGAASSIAGTVSLLVFFQPRPVAGKRKT